jgi:hypothetical protein
MSADGLVNVLDAIEEDGELLPVDIGCQVGLSLLLLLERLLAEPLSPLLALPFFLLVGRLLVERLCLLLGNETFDNLFKALLVSGLLDLKPVDHDGVLELDGELPAILLLLVIVNDVPSRLVLEIMTLREGILNDVVEGRLLCRRVHQLYLKLGQSLIQLNVLLTQVLDGVDVDEEDGDC